ncbi:RacP protein [Actinomadura rudentiformis]|uniref:RacP protein n=1 Tax=Actinomadura rudentiformis TaxID=359158 RepID=A0A6H9YK72_9ACTN|nr:RacP protein [Actinomadura rudentiformis]KAB2340548.1 RacP protein [Actinomadura rudentiformis]
MGRASGRRLAASVCAERITMALKEARPAGLTTKQLVTSTGLTISQVRSGLLYIRTTAAMANLTPLTWTRAEGWKLSLERAEWAAFVRAVSTQACTRMDRLMTSTIGPWAALMPDDDDVQLILDQITGVRAALIVLSRDAAN